MPVNSRHAQYALRQGQWKRCRDCVGGTDRIKAPDVQQTYLPKLGGQDLPSYGAYLLRALFYPATERTVQGLTGLMLRKPAVLEVPLAVERDLLDLTRSGTSWEALQLDVIDEILTVGSVGVLIDVAQDGDVRPYWSLYRAEQIVSWRIGPVRWFDGTTRFQYTRVVLEEDTPVPDPADPFTEKTETRYRVLELVEGRYTITLWRPVRLGEPAAASGSPFIAEEPIIPQRKGQALAAIPFVRIGARHVRAWPDKPPILDLVDVNLSHYRSSADLEHGRHWTGLPTPWVTGVPSGTTELRIGSEMAWTFIDPAARVGMLEFTGTGLGALEKALEQKERQMAVLGARLLEGKPLADETAESVRLRHAGDVATLSTIACSLDEGLTLAFRWHAWWGGDDDAWAHDDAVVVAVNKDFFGTPMESTMAQTALTMWQAGGFSWKTFFWLLQRGEWMRPGVTEEEERALIDAEAMLSRLPAEEDGPAGEPPPEPSGAPERGPAGESGNLP
jgi:hypothetical protein